ncbi:MAG TPA: hypothetical protein VLF14_03260, partial [Candidatus Binatia bacterium]|nr:hypothetical protein [Candidatus Binatia bacterium]
RVCLLVWLVAGAVGALSSACLATRRHVSPECLPDPEAHCRSQCGRHDTAPSETREGRCEATVGDLCRAHCLEACGDHSSSLTKKIEAYESSLEHDCGSGEPIGPGEMRPPPVRPTPHPLDRLLREACAGCGRAVFYGFSTNGDG